MDTKISYKVFEYNPETPIFELEPAYSELAGDLNYELLKEAFLGGFSDGKTIYIDKFLRDDLSINLEKLELAVILTVEHLEIVTDFDDPIVLYIDGLQQYYELRGIADKPMNMKEEYYVIRGIIQAVANQQSIKPIKVEYVSDTADPTTRGE